MKTDSDRRLLPAPPQEGSLLDQIRNDRELVARLKITPQELQALSKCSLLGTLTCKEDMLFILRQIREATNPSSSGRIPVFPQPASDPGDEDQEEALPDFRRSRLVADFIPEPGSLDAPVRRRLPVQFGIIFLAAITAAALFWNGTIAISHWRDTLMTRVGTSVSQARASGDWFNHLDRFSVLLSWEVLFVVGMIGAIYLRSLKGSSRFKVRPGRRY